MVRWYEVMRWRRARDWALLWLASFLMGFLAFGPLQSQLPGIRAVTGITIFLVVVIALCNVAIGEQEA